MLYYVPMHRGMEKPKFFLIAIEICDIINKGGPRYGTESNANTKQVVDKTFVGLH